MVSKIMSLKYSCEPLVCRCICVCRYCFWWATNVWTDCMLTCRLKCFELSSWPEKTQIQALCCFPCVFPHWPGCHFSLWSLAGHVGVVCAHWQFTVVCEQEMRSLSCCMLCCKLTTAVSALTGKTPNPSTTSSPQPPEISCSSAQPFIFCPANQHFHTPYPLLSHKSPSECHARTLSLWGPIIFSPAAIHDGPAAFPTLYFDSPTVPCKGPVTIKHGVRGEKSWITKEVNQLLYWASS